MSKVINALTKTLKAASKREHISPEELWQSKEMQKFVAEIKQKMQEENLSYKALAELKQKLVLEPLLAELKNLEEKDRDIAEKINNQEIGWLAGNELRATIQQKKQKLQKKIERTKYEYMVDWNLSALASELDRLPSYNRAIELTQEIYNTILNLVPKIDEANKLFGADCYAPTGFTTIREAIYGILQASWNIRDIYKKDAAELEKQYFIALKAMWDRLDKQEKTKKLLSEFKEAK